MSGERNNGGLSLFMMTKMGGYSLFITRSSQFHTFYSSNGKYSLYNIYNINNMYIIDIGGFFIKLTCILKHISLQVYFALVTMVNWDMWSMKLAMYVMVSIDHYLITM